MTLREAQRGFLDRARIERAVDRGKRRALARGGGYVRRVARSSMKRRRGRSRPGQPPHAHAGLLKLLMIFAYDQRTGSVVVGPARLNSVHGPPAPGTLERGGYTRRPRWWSESSRPYIYVRPRPFMGPALVKSQEKIASFWRDSVTA